MAHAGGAGRTVQIRRAIGDAAVAGLELETVLPRLATFGVPRARGTHAVALGLRAVVVVVTAARQQGKREQQRAGQTAAGSAQAMTHLISAQPILPPAFPVGCPPSSFF